MKHSKILFILFSLFIASCSSCKKDSPDPLLATTLILESGNEQSTTIESNLQEVIIVTVFDQYNNPFEGASVHFSVSEGFVSQNTATSNINGQISTTWMLGSTVGTQTLTVTAFKEDGVTPLVGSPLLIEANGTAVPPHPASIELVEGDNQMNYINTELANSIQVLVKDQYGNVFENAIVNYSPEKGTVSNATANTNSEGIAEVKWTMGTEKGSHNLLINAYEEDGTTLLEGAPITVSAFAAPTSITDVDANNYGVVIIGMQAWMASNLKATHYDNAGTQGDVISHVTDATTWSNLLSTDKAYCYYDNNSGSDYGVLYNWAAAMSGANASSASPSGVQGICPTGWHVPSEAEFTELIDHLGGSTVAGGKLKETGTSHWFGSNTGTTNESGFTALPGGFRRGSDALFMRVTMNVLYQTTTIRDYSVVHMSLSFGNANTYLNLLSKKEGMSVRCIMNK